MTSRHAPRQRVSSGSQWEERIGYSRAVRAGDLVWVSGTTGTHADGTVPEDVLAQTRVALRIIEQALGEAGASLGDVVMVRVYLTDIEHWRTVGDALHERFADVKPAMVMVQVARLIAPEHRVEIEVEAVTASA